MIIIEEANKLDIPDIEDLYIQLFNYISDLQPNNFRPAQQNHDFIVATIEDTDSTIFVAKENTKVLGFILVKEQSTPPYNCFIQRRLAYILDLVVDSKHRGRGVGKFLMDKAENWALDRKLDYLELSVLDENLSAKSLYEQLGFKSSIQTMEKRLK